MRFRNTLILGVLCVALGAYVYFVEFEKAAEDAKKKTLITVEQDAITAVTLTYPDRELVVTKSGDTWTLSKPLQAAADQTSVKNLVRAIAECELKKTLDEAPKDLSPFGLDKPAVTITVSTKDKTLPAIKVGKNTPIGYNTYVQIEGNPKIFLTGSAFEAGMKKEAKDLRDRSVFSFDDAAVNRITLIGGEQDVILARSGEKWKIEQPGPYEADAAAVRNLINSLKNMRAEDFPPEDAPPATYGLDQPRLTITLTVGEKNEQKKLLVGNQSEKKDSYVKVADRPTIFSVSEWSAKNVSKSVADLRDKTVIAFDTKSVDKVTLQRGGETIRLSRTEKTPWKIEGNDAAPDQDTVDRFLDDLKELAGFEIATDDASQHEALGLGTPTFRITLEGASGPIGTVKFGSYPRGDNHAEYAAALEGSSTAYKLREPTFNRLNKSMADFLPKPTPIPAPEGAAEADDSSI